MPALALPPTTAYPSNPKALEREQLDALYLELRGNYKSLMISRGIHRSRAERQSAQLRELSTRVRTLALKNSKVRTEAYAMLKILNEVVENLEDSGDELSNAFDEYQRGGRAYNGGGRIARLVQAMIDYLNRWRQGKQRFKELDAQQKSLRDALDNNPADHNALPGGDGAGSGDAGSGTPEAQAADPNPPASNETPPTNQAKADLPQPEADQPASEPDDGRDR